MKVGNDYKVKIALKKDGLCQGNTAPYPEWYQCWIPVTCVWESPFFYVVSVREHQNPAAIFKCPWVPYTVTIDKFDIGKNIFVKED